MKPRMKKSRLAPPLKTLFLALSAVLFFSCAKNEDADAYNAFENWALRNTEWFNSLLTDAREQIAAGDTSWRVIPSASLTGDDIADDEYIVMHMVRSCPDAASPMYNDTVRVNYRGWIMPATYRIDGRDTTYCAVFDQSFYGYYGPDDMTVFNDATAYPACSAVNAYVDGFSTALQNMREGEQAHVYIPSYLAYGATGSGSILGGTTLHFFIHLRAVYPIGTTVPDWK